MIATRRDRCFREGTFFENRFAMYLEGKGVTYEAVVGTDADTKGKVDFVVKGLAVQVKSPTRSGPRGLCTEWRAVNGSIGWLHKADYVVKFISDDTYVRISCRDLKEHVIATRGTPPVLCPQTGARSSKGAWYARPNRGNRDRTKEACIMIPSKEVLPFSSIVRI